ncbi:MAG: DUF192 domain-containing protein [Steroidobacteraceae bacterium]
MNRFATTWLSVALLLASACVQPAAQQEFQPAQLRDFPRGELTIERAGGRDSFRIWYADTEERSQQGLMWIRQLPRDYGMLFPLDPPRELFMWMKNTYVPLDMLFYDSTGRITHIHAGATPLSEAIIESSGKVSGVLEILAGEAQRRGIRIGDRLVTKGPRRAAISATP